MDLSQLLSRRLIITNKVTEISIRLCRMILLFQIQSRQPLLLSQKWFNNEIRRVNCWRRKWLKKYQLHNYNNRCLRNFLWGNFWHIFKKYRNCLIRWILIGRTPKINWKVNSICNCKLLTILLRRWLAKINKKICVFLG